MNCIMTNVQQVNLEYFLGLGYVEMRITDPLVQPYLLRLLVEITNRFASSGYTVYAFVCKLSCPLFRHEKKPSKVSSSSFCFLT